MTEPPGVLTMLVLRHQLCRHALCLAHDRLPLVDVLARLLQQHGVVDYRIETLTADQLIEALDQLKYDRAATCGTCRPLPEGFHVHA